MLINHLNQLSVEKLDYIIANHAEQDHSGTIPQIMRKYPQAKVIATPKCKDLLISLLSIPEDKVMTVSEKETDNDNHI